MGRGDSPPLPPSREEMAAAQTHDAETERRLLDEWDESGRGLNYGDPCLLSLLIVLAIIVKKILDSF